MAETERLDGRDGKIWSAYVGGMSQDAIAAEHGISQQRVSQVLAEVRASIPDDDRTDAALLARERTNALLAAVWPAAMAGDTKAALACLRVVERIAKSLGTDAVEPISVSFERHLDDQGHIVVAAVTAALEVLQLDEERRQLAVRAAVAQLSGEPLPEPLAPVVEVPEPDLMEDFRRFAEREGFDPDGLDDDQEDDGDGE